MPETTDPATRYSSGCCRSRGSAKDIQRTGTIRTRLINLIDDLLVAMVSCAGVWSVKAINRKLFVIDLIRWVLGVAWICLLSNDLISQGTIRSKQLRG